ncbi:MAG: transglutaminase-like domain-containing protein [Phycisphaerales bacterium]
MAITQSLRKASPLLCLAGVVLTMSAATLATLAPRPVNALRRYEPKKYSFVMDVTLSTTVHPVDVRQRGLFNFEEAPIVMPIIYQGAYSLVFVNTEGGRIIIDSTLVPDQMLAKATLDNKPFGTHLLRMVTPKTTGGMVVQFQVGFDTQSWSAAIDERLAQQATWPRDLAWPEEAVDGLGPSKFIESDHDIFKAIIQEQGGLDQMRTAPPYIVAKQITAYCLNRFQISGASQLRGHVGQLRGLVVHGALAVAANPDPQGRWIGTDADLVCVCVAMLRAAGIPARPVIGVTDALDSATGKATNRFVTWAEFYLPGSGWCSFDPVAMRGRGAAIYRNIADAWPEFGTMEDLNLRVPLSYFFLPPAQGVESPGFDTVALWGWDPRPQPRQDSYEQAVNFQITSRGKGVEDPG